MMMLKLISSDGYRTRIVEAESFTVLHDQGPAPSIRWAEITGHRPDGNDFRYDVGQSPHPEKERIFGRAYIENSLGKTVERIDYTMQVSAAA